MVSCSFVKLSYVLRNTVTNKVSQEYGIHILNHLYMQHTAHTHPPTHTTHTLYRYYILFSLPNSLNTDCCSSIDTKQVRGVSCGCGKFSQDAHLSADNPCRDTSTPTLITTLNGEGNLLSLNIELPSISLL